MWWPVTMVPAALKCETRHLLLAQGWEDSLRDIVRQGLKTEKAREVNVEIETGDSLMMLWFP